MIENLTYALLAGAGLCALALAAIAYGEHVEIREELAAAKRRHPSARKPAPSLFIPDQRTPGGQS